jgi:serine/threonine protein kinase
MQSIFAGMLLLLLFSPIAQRSLFKHPNIIRLLGYTGTGAAQGAADVYIVYEMGSRGSLGSNLRDDGKARELTWRARVRVARGLAKALNYLHCHQPSNPVYHRDVKSDNVRAILAISSFSLAPRACHWQDYVNPHDCNITISQVNLNIIPHSSSISPLPHLPFFDHGSEGLLFSPTFSGITLNSDMMPLSLA